MEVEKLKRGLDAICGAIKANEPQALEIAKAAHEDYFLSAKNLYHYLLLRSYDLRQVQDELSEMGLSSLRTAEGYVLANLRMVVQILNKITQSGYKMEPHLTELGYQKSRQLLQMHAQNLFGEPEEGINTKIMVTMPKEAADDPKIIEGMVNNGMRIARINLGRDNEEVWQRMLHHIRQVEQKTATSVKVYMDLAGPKIRTVFYSQKGKRIKERTNIPVQEGEYIILTKEKIPTEKSKFNKKGEQVKKAHLGVTLPQLIDDLKLGHPVLFDDGIIQAEVTNKFENAIELQIKKCFKPKLGSQKGINLPNTVLNLPAMTEDDVKVLPFACKHADIIGYSFVRSKEDVAVLYQELEHLAADEVGVVFKIENQEAFENFPEILFKGMERNRIGVMIARGDLAVEIGFERISEVQMELLWICEAAHIPVIWATQVLETLAKKGIPTRAEISDAAHGARAECVMLNKGPHILEAISILRNILDKMDAHMSKKKESLRALNIAKDYLAREPMVM